MVRIEKTKNRVKFDLEITIKTIDSKHVKVISVIETADSKRKKMESLVQRIGFKYREFQQILRNKNGCETSGVFLIVEK